jgi:hypothetical protein
MDCIDLRCGEKVHTEFLLGNMFESCGLEDEQEACINVEWTAAVLLLDTKRELHYGLYSIGIRNQVFCKGK